MSHKFNMFNVRKVCLLIFFYTLTGFKQLTSPAKEDNWSASSGAAPTGTWNRLTFTSSAKLILVNLTVL